MGSVDMRKEMQDFQTSIKNLSIAVGQASSLWKDEKYSELSATIGKLANDSKDVIVTGERCCLSIDKFLKVAEEKY